VIAAILVDPRYTVPAAIVIAGIIGWYWWRLGRTSVPRSRRLIRRVSMVLVLLLLPGLVRGLSYVDADVDGQAFVVTWSVTTLLVLLVLLVACIDALLTLGQERCAMERGLSARLGDEQRGDAQS
jgi:hypothetical protein